MSLLTAAFVHEWLLASGVRAGLTGATAGGRSVRWDDIRGAQPDVWIAGYLAFAGSLVGSGLLIALVTGKQQLAPITKKVLLVTSVLMVWFCVDAMIFDQVRGTTPGVGVLLGVGGALGALSLLRKRT